MPGSVFEEGAAAFYFAGTVVGRDGTKPNAVTVRFKVGGAPPAVGSAERTADASSSPA